MDRVRPRRLRQAGRGPANRPERNKGRISSIDVRIQRAGQGGGQAAVEARVGAVRRRARQDPPRRRARLIRPRVHRGTRARRRALPRGLCRARRHLTDPRVERHRGRVAGEQRGERARGAQGDAERHRAMPPRR